jgi:anaerobic selenocysteine-containing dehydrogenase
MVLEQVDPSNQAVREAVLVSRADAERLGLANGDPVVLHSDVGEYRGRVHIAPVTPGSLQVHWPEGQVLIDRHHRSPQAGIPDFNAFCTLEKVEATEPAPVPTG